MSLFLITFRVNPINIPPNVFTLYEEQKYSMKLKEGELNAYWREAKRRQFAKLPDHQARKALREYSSKKEQMKAIQQTDPNWEESLLTDLISEIRGILGKKEEKK